MVRELQYWVPWKLTKEFDCRWLYTDDLPFTDPFFDDTISACRRLSVYRSHYSSVSSLEMLRDWGEQLQGPSPSAIIFHVSRCGSTLLSQLLSRSADNLVLSEVPFLDDLLRLPFRKKDIKPEKTSEYLHAAIQFYGQPRLGKYSHLFIKSDSWHLHFYEQLRSLFPYTKFILLYRDPREVLLSQQRQRGLQSVPGLLEYQIFNLNKVDSQITDPDKYMGRVLESYFNKMIQILEIDPNVMAFNYSDGMINIASRLYKLLKTPVFEQLLNDWTERSRFNAKHPHHLFHEETTEFLKKDILDPLMPLYDTLDSLTKKKSKLAENKTL